MHLIGQMWWFLGISAMFLIKSAVKLLVSVLPIKMILKKEFEKMDIFINLTPQELSQKRLENPKAVTIKILDDSAYMAFAVDGTHDALESFAQGHWDCDVSDLPEIFGRGMRRHCFYSPINLILTYIEYNLMQILGNVKTEHESGKAHYNFGNEHFASFIGPTKAYSCGIWKNAQNSDEAQLYKMDLIARKLKLRPGMRVLDIGCGWGAMAKYFAENYQVQVVAVTNSVEGATFTIQFCKGLPVEVRVIDYRFIDEMFDRILCVEMMEHIGPSNYRSFQELVHRCLADDGLYLLQVTVSDNRRGAQYSRWVGKRILPHAAAPTQMELIQSLNGLFTIEDVQNIGLHYPATWEAWLNNFISGWPYVKHLYPQNPQHIYRSWILYFTICFAVFKERALHMWQIVLTKDGKCNGIYETPR